MNSEIQITPENVSVESLRAAFEQALFDTTTDSDGDLVVRDRYKVSVTIHSERFIRFVAVFALKEDSNTIQAYELVNRINFDLICIRAAAHEDRRALFIDWYLPIQGGLSRKSMIVAFRAFSDLLNAVGRLDEEDIVE